MSGRTPIMGIFCITISRRKTARPSFIGFYHSTSFSFLIWKATNLPIILLASLFEWQSKRGQSFGVADCRWPRTHLKQEKIKGLLPVYSWTPWTYLVTPLRAVGISGIPYAPPLLAIALWYQSQSNYIFDTVKEAGSCHINMSTLN